MKYYTFFREDNNFDGILKDTILKPIVDTKIKWYQHLMIGVSDKNEGTLSYLTLKYGDEIVQNNHKDLTPVAGVDYVPKKDKTKFIKVIE
jgi:hypothetical protein